MLNKEKDTNLEMKTQGRPSSAVMLNGLNQKLVQSCSLLHGELHSKMVEFAGESEVYSIKRLKQKLQEHYKEHAFFSEMEGRSNVLCFKNMVEYIINET